MEINYFYSLTPREFTNISKGKIDKIRQQHRESWEQNRWLAYILVKPYDAKNRIKMPSDVQIFPWEKGFEKKQKKHQSLTKEFIDSLATKKE